MSTIQHRLTTTGHETWRVVLRVNGRQKALTFTSLPAAQNWQRLVDSAGYALAMTALEVDAPPPDERTVATQVAHHIDHLTGVDAGTVSDYRSYLRRHIDPYLGHLPISLLTRDHVSTWVNTLSGNGLAAKTVKHRHALLSASLKSAVRDGLIVANVAEGIKLPKASHDNEMITLDPEEVMWLAQCAPERWRRMVVMLVGTGMRFGEVTALTVGDVDLPNRTARVRQAWKHTDGHGHRLGPPKSRKSLRTVNLGAVADVIRPLVEGRNASEFVFTNSRGGPVRRSNFDGEAWTPTVHAFAGDSAAKKPTARGRSPIVWTRGKGKRPRVHDMRHTYASIKIKEGKSMAWLQKQLGHESIDTTIRTYTHLQTADLAQLGDVVEWETLVIGTGR